MNYMPDSDASRIIDNVSMGSLSSYSIFLTALIAFTGCSTSGQPVLRDFEQLTPVTIMDAPAPDPARVTAADQEQTVRGKYLVELLGCGSCHTDGALTGLPNNDRLLAGSRTGIAYSDPLRQKNPGVVYPSNLTPDAETGIGAWSDREVVNMITSGIDKHGRRKLPIMPWPAYTRLSDADARAIVSYLRSLTPVSHKIPDSVNPGEKATQPFVYFGVYRKRP
jgi:mono/diheme cytochrome c family protein